MANNYDNPVDQIKAVSWQLKRIADALENTQPQVNKKPVSMSDSFGVNLPKLGKPSSLRDFLSKLGEE